MQKNQEIKNQSALHKNSNPQSQLIEIKRPFNVPVDRLFSAFKTKEAIEAWWWPKGLHADQVKLEFRSGGKYFINMKGFDQGGGGMVGQFEEVVENKSIVMSDQFADEKGQAISAQDAKMPGVWPEFVYITFEFLALGETLSELKLSQEGIPNESQKDCIQGWNEMFDKLEGYLKSH